MNKAAVVAKVSERSGVPVEACEHVLKALEQTLQEELDGSGGLGKITGFLQYLVGEKKG